jgi:hypothetical protein
MGPPAWAGGPMPAVRWPLRAGCELEAFSLTRWTVSTLLVGCDNNLPNTGRNPNLADNNEFILIHVNGLPADPDQKP